MRKPAANESETGAMRALRVLWSMTAADAPAWILALATCITSIWTISFLGPGNLAEPDGTSIGGLALLMRDTGWAIWSGLTTVLSFPVLVARVDGQKFLWLSVKAWRIAGLLASGSFFSALALLMILATPHRPWGWLHLPLAGVCIVACWRALLTPSRAAFRAMIQASLEDEDLE